MTSIAERRDTGTAAGKADPRAAAEEMARALGAGWLELWYQPKIGSQTLDLRGAEALIRMRHPELSIIAPAGFMPRMGERLLPALSQFVIARALADWRYFLTERRPLDLSVNLPISFLDDPASFDYLCRQLPDDPAFEGLILEIDGNEIARDLAAARDFARQARLRKVAISVDRLGGESTALLQLRDFPSSKSRSSQNWWPVARMIAQSRPYAAISSMQPINSAPARWRSA